MERYHPAFGSIAVFLCVFSACFSGASAARITAQVPPMPVGVGDSFVLPILFETDGDAINALEGVVRYPRGILQLEEIRDGNSIVDFWIEKPHDVAGAIRFSGVTPGGFPALSGEIFTLVFRAQRAGMVSLALDGGRALLNDGRGTRAALSVAFPTLTVSAKGSGARVESLAQSDHEPPEAFTPKIATAPSAFGSAYILVFATQDKKSGVDHYEVAQRAGFRHLFFGGLSWQKAESPYPLSDQSLQSYIYVRAVDRAGNERLALLSPEHLPLYYNENLLLAILVVLALLVYIGRFRVRHDRRIS